MIGVENRTKDPQVLTYDGKTRNFKPGEVKLVDGVPAAFIEGRVHHFHPKSKDEQGREVQSQTVLGLRLFDIIPIDEALKKGAKLEEDPQVAAARAVAEAAKKERAQLLKELKESLVEDGWTPPQKTQPQEGAPHDEL